MRELWSSGAHQDQQKVQLPISFMIYTLSHLCSFLDSTYSYALSLEAWRKTIANRRTNSVQTMSSTERHNEAGGWVQRLCVRNGHPCNLAIVAGFVRCPYVFVRATLTTLVIARRGGKCLSQSIMLYSYSCFFGRAMHSRIFAGTDLAFTRGYKMDFGTRLSLVWSAFFHGTHSADLPFLCIEYKQTRLLFTLGSHSTRFLLNVHRCVVY